MTLSTQLVRRMIDDPLVFGRVCWPKVRFHSKQEEFIYSVDTTPETFVPAGNMLGKDFGAGFLALTYTLRHDQVRVVSTSVKEKHLDVLWAEINRFIQTSRLPMTAEKGGPLKCNHLHIRKCKNAMASLCSGVRCKEEDTYSYLKGMVAGQGESLSGHHAEHTLAIIDEASGVPDEYYKMMKAWAKRMFVFGNCWEPVGRFFQEAVEKGDIVDLRWAAKVG